MSDTIKKLLAMAAVVIILIAVMVVFSQVPTVPAGEVAKDVEVTIAELAYSYTGTLSRPLFPEVSLGLPLMLQVVLSALIVLLMVGTALFAPGARRFVMLLTVASTTRHLLFRGFETLDLGTPLAGVISVVIYAAEFLAFFSMVLGYFQVWGQTDRKPVSLSKYPSDQLPLVDIYLCTYNEPVSVLYRSLVGAKSIDYPNKAVYLLDDGNRPEMRELADKLDVHYIARSENVHAKAGNMNNAMRHTKGDLIVIFDADHVPCKTFLQETVGFFLADTEMAFVQTPQHFFTEDPFQRNLVASQAINNEQDLFFHVIEAGNDYWGAAFFGGSGAIFRRKALESVGGFAVETITEDVHTGLRLHAKGWKSLFYNRDLAAGLAQDTFADFIKQRLRWTRGMTQILIFDNPLFIGGLNLAQRLCYFSGIWYFFHGLPRIVFLIAPLFFLLFGYKTINAGFVEVMVYYLPSFICIFLGYTIISRGVRHSFWSEVYETAFCVYVFLTNLATVLSPKRAKFRVTPKGTLTDKMNFNWRVVFPQVMIASLTIVGIGMAIVRGMYTPEYAGGIYTNMFWSMYNMVLLLGAIYVAQERPQFRLAPRIFRRIRCELKLLDGSIAVGYTTNISESGLAVVFNEPVPISGTVQLKLMDWEINETSVINVQAVRSSLNQYNQHFIGFTVVNRTDEQHQKLIRHMFGSADIWQEDMSFRSTGNAFLDLITSPFRITGTMERAFRRRTPRFHVTLSCVLNVDGRFIIGFSDDVSESGISVFLKKREAVQIGQRVRVRIQWPSGQISEVDSDVVRLEDVGGGQVRAGLNFTVLTTEQHLELIRNIYRPAEGLIRVAPSVNRMLNCRIVRGNGEQVRGLTQEVSELGLIINLHDAARLQPGEKVRLHLQWGDEAEKAYPAIIKDMQPYANMMLVLAYFDGLDVAAMDDLSQRLHEPSESRAFRTLIG